MKKRVPFFVLIVIALICSFVCSFLVCDEEESAKEQFFNDSGINSYALALQEKLTHNSIFYLLCEEAQFSSPEISYLAQHEKSPPVLS
jgi:hypothetical protein